MPQTPKAERLSRDLGLARDAFKLRDPRLSKLAHSSSDAKAEGEPKHAKTLIGQPTCASKENLSSANEVCF
jgi:hypothetical protein